MMIVKRKRHGAALVGVLFLLVGAFFLLDNFRVLPEHISFDDWWPLILVAVGLYQLFSNADVFEFGGWLLIVLGVGFLFAEQGRFGITWHNLWKYWPILLIFLGLSMLFGRRRAVGCLSNHRNERSGESELGERVVLGGIEKEIVTEDFRGGQIEVVLGSAELDLSHAKMKEESARLDIRAVMGSVELRIPREWRVELLPHSVMGSVENRANAAGVESQKKLVVAASTVMGSIEIFH